MNLSKRLSALVLGFFALGALPALAQTELVTNGGFESGDFTGWSVVNDEPGGNPSTVATVEVYGPGTSALFSGWPIPDPTEGAFAAFTDMNNSSVNILYQDLAIPAGSTAQLSLDLYYANFANITQDPTAGACGLAEGDIISLPPPGDVFFQNDPATLNAGALISGANQRVRVDIADPAADPKELGAAVLQTVFDTGPGSAPEAPFSTLNADLSAFAGQTVRLRITNSYSYCFLHMAVDNVSVTATAGPPPPPPAPAVPVPVDKLLALLALMLLLFAAGAWSLQRRS